MFLNLLKSPKNQRGKVRSFLACVCLTIGLLALGTTSSWADHLDSNPSNHAPRTSHARDPDRPATPQVPPTSPSDDSPGKAEKIQWRLTQRYGNPLVERFVRNVSAERAMNLFVESSRLIDTRHLQPSSYETRIKQALGNLRQAVENPAFLQANRLSPSRHEVNAFRNSLDRLILSQPVRTSRDALNILYKTVEIARQHVGMRPTAVVLEFVYGSLESLDKYSTFVPQENSRQPSVNLDDHVVGIGVEIKPHDSGILVVKTLRGGPAAEAGLRGGDVVVSVNGRKLEGRNLNYAADLITGPAGSQVFLGVHRNGRAISPMTLTRRRVTIYSVSEIRMLDDEAKVGYLKLDKFAKSSSDEMDRALWDLYRRGMKSLIIDLRGNPGGLLTTAIELSDKFLPCGAIVSTRGRTKADQSAERATYEQTWKVPLVVLVDQNSASASEIFAAAIQENQRGVIVGRRSYGKGTVQTHFPLQSVSGNLRLTTARFYSPNGRVMAGNGVEPDVQVDESTSNDSAHIDRDIKTAVAVAKSQRLRDFAAKKSNCHIPGHRELLP